jgi:hypothetical protein
MRILANIWHLIGRLYHPAAWRIFTTKSVQALGARAFAYLENKYTFILIIMI